MQRTALGEARRARVGDLHQPGGIRLLLADHDHGALVALVVAGVVLYLIGVLSMYMIAWVVWIIQAIFG